MRLLVCSEQDLPSVNMRAWLTSFHDWEDMGSEDGLSYISYGDTAMVTMTDLHIYHEDLAHQVEDFGIKVDDVIFMSRHAAKSGKPALTVHPIGNYHENRFGGRVETLVRPSPSLMTDALRAIVATNDMEDTQTCFEVTHHGPWLDRPTFYIEVGSEQTHWENKHAAEILAHVIDDLKGDNGYPVAVGVGGGHYAPRFTEVALKYRLNFGHMLPNYQMEGRDDDDIVRTVSDACRVTDTKLVYLHRKSMKKPEERRIAGLIESSGFEIVSSKDLEPISGN